MEIGEDVPTALFISLRKLLTAQTPKRKVMSGRKQAWFTYEEVPASPSPFLCSQLLTDIINREGGHRGRV